MEIRYTMMWLTLAAAATMAGCARPTIEQRLASDDPKIRLGAVYELASVPGSGADVRLIHELADEDEAVRLFAAAALRRRNGCQSGFMAEGRRAERAAAIRRWIDWCAETYPDTKDGFADLRASLDAFEGKPTEQPKTEEP